MFKNILKILGILFLLLICLGLWIAISTGFFRKIENPYQGKVKQTIKVKGSEDFAISRKDSFLIVSSCDFGQLRGDNPQEGQLGFIDLRKEPYVLKKMDLGIDIPFFPHGISMIEKISNQYQLYVINHRSHDEHWVEVFDLKGDTLIYVQSIKDEKIHHPNDLVAIGDGKFYITNDHGSKTKFGLLLEEQLGLKRSGVVYYDNGNSKEVADGIAYANGINCDLKRNLVYVASPRNNLLKVYHQKENGDLKYITKVDCGTGIDNLELDKDGNIWSGGHPNLLAFSTYARAPDGTKIAPSEVVKITYNDKNHHSVESIYMDDGKVISGSSVALPFDNQIFVGAVKHDQMIVLEQ